METLDDWFPYPGYRPNQRRMLEEATAVARDGGCLMVDAPTGSGKSSVVSALLAARERRKVVVAVRTISQQNTFIRELSLIRGVQPRLRFAFLVGKRGTCPLGGQGDVYRRCEGVKSFSTTLMRSRAEQGSLVPAKDPVIRQQIRRMDREHPLICPYYIQSRVFVDQDTAGLRMIPSPSLLAVADRILARDPGHSGVTNMCGDICPYEAMLCASQKADVIILNYHHLFDEEIRGQIFFSLGLEPLDILLLIDEAHNCGDVMQDVQTIAVDEESLTVAGAELAALRRTEKGVDGIIHVLPQITAFMDGLKSSDEIEDWFDPAIFDRMVLKGSLFRSMDDVVEEMMRISGRMRERMMKSGEFRETALERLTGFLFRLTQSATDPAFLTVYRKQEQGIRLEVQNIDPCRKLEELVSMHHATVLISGTLSPVDSYRRYYFEEMPVATCTLPNSFPRENRLVVAASDVTTAFSRRQDRENQRRIGEYIRQFARLPGNLACYFPSYQFLELYARNGTGSRKEVFIEPKDPGDAGKALAEFLSLPGTGSSGLLLAVCGGKWSEGLDYRGELLSGAMVIGLPLAPFTPVRRMLIDYYRKKFGEEGEFISYTLPALNRAQQALGRVLRTPEDRGVLVLAEQRFLEPRIRSRLPSWIRDEMIPCRSDTFGRITAGFGTGGKPGGR